MSWCARTTFRFRRWALDGSARFGAAGPTTPGLVVPPILVGKKVLAAKDGTVVLVRNDVAENVPGETTNVTTPSGNVVIIDHGNGITTLYGHLSRFAVNDGEFIHRGQVLGYVGDSGRSTGPHLHYEVRLHDTPVNPYKFMRSTMARLSFSIQSGS